MDLENQAFFQVNKPRLRATDILPVKIKQKTNKLADNFVYPVDIIKPLMLSIGMNKNADQFSYFPPKKIRNENHFFAFVEIWKEMIAHD